MAAQRENTWPADFIERARALWNEGYSARVIGELLEVSKNSIIGIAHWNKFPSRPSPIKRVA
jgi:hypothetical protein